jgi:hypothetical protein
MTRWKNPAEPRTVEIWKSQPHDSQIPTAPAAAVFYQPKTTTEQKVLPMCQVQCVTYVPVRS